MPLYNVGPRNSPKSLSYWDIPKAEGTDQPYNMILAVSFGYLIPQRVLKTAKWAFNVHPSLLPLYPGRTPIHDALLNQDEVTGISIQTMHPKIFDRGLVVSQTEPVPILSGESLQSLTTRLTLLSQSHVADFIQSKKYSTTPTVQDQQFFCDTSVQKHAPRTQRHISFTSMSGRDLDAHARVFGSIKAILNLASRKKGQDDGQQVILSETSFSDERSSDEQEGTIIAANGKKCMAVACKTGTLFVRTIQIPSKRKMDAFEFLQTAHLKNHRITIDPEHSTFSYP